MFDSLAMHLFATALLAAPLVQDFSIPNGDFESAAALWGAVSGSSVVYESEAGPRTENGAGGANLVAKFPGGEPQAIWRTVQLRDDSRLNPPTTAEQLGTKVEFGVWFRTVGDDHGANDNVALRIKSGDSIIAENRVDPRDYPGDTWHYIATQYDPASGLDGCVRHGSVGLTVVLEVDAKSEVWLDDVEGRPFEYHRWPLVDASFERPEALGETPADDWLRSGAGSIDRGVKAYYGERTLVLKGGRRASVIQRIASQVHGAEPQTGVVPEAGVWVRITGGDLDPMGTVRLQVWHEHVLQRLDGGGSTRLKSLLAEGVLAVPATPADRWVYLETDPTRAVPLPPRGRRTLETNVLVRLAKNTTRRVRFDFVQVGEAHAVDGNPMRFAFANYMARFRNPGFAPDPLVDDPSNGLGRRWKGWHWDRPPACGADPSLYVHDPTRLRPGSNPHDADRRDLAISAWSERPLPLLGAYDSRDPSVIGLHVRLAKAAGLDGLMLGWYGQKAVELDQCSPRLDSVNGPTLSQMYDSIDALVSDLKVCVKLNLQRHLNNTFEGAPPGCPFLSEDTHEQKRKGIIDDLIWLVETYHGRRATLKRDGRMVVSIFDPERRFQDENGIWTRFGPPDWILIKDQVELATGHRLELLFDNAPRLVVPLEEAGAWYEGIADGLANWTLALCPLALFADFDDFQNGNSRLITEDAVRIQFREQINGRPYRWWRRDDARRLGIAIAYPGFDDTGVAGWGVLNGACEDHGPRCARVVPASDLHDHADCAPGSRTCFLEIAMQEAVASGMNWLQVPTWNDWNELTMIEPSYSALYVNHVLSGAPDADTDYDREWVLGRLLATQAGLAAFKGIELDPLEIDAIVEAFLIAQGGTPYD